MDKNNSNFMAEVDQLLMEQDLLSPGTSDNKPASGIFSNPVKKSG